MEDKCNRTNRSFAAVSDAAPNNLIWATRRTLPKNRRPFNAKDFNDILKSVSFLDTDSEKMFSIWNKRSDSNYNLKRVLSN